MAVVDVTINHISAARMLEIVRELKDNGQVIGVDFDFSYVPHKTYRDSDGEYTEVPKHGEFRFYNEVYSSWFVMKYGE